MGIPRPEPVEMHAHAIDNLRYIRKTMERAGSFTAVPGIGGMLMGSTALAAAWIASHQPEGFSWMAIWLAEALVALAIGLDRKSTRLNSSHGYISYAVFCL